MVRGRQLLLVFFSLVQAGCQDSVSAGSCSIICSAEGSCPGGMICSVDGFCHERGDTSDCGPDAAPQPLIQPDAGVALSCPACNTPPSACASACETVVFENSGECIEGECVYDPVFAQNCDFGCDPATGTCAHPSALCAGELCGTTIECGGTCAAGTGAGCCTPESYVLSSGFTGSGTVLCCNGNDVRTNIADCGNGSNHWVQGSGNQCGVAYEGGGNYGSPCVQLTCERLVCQ